jgi:hypothetical protein
MSKGKKVFIMAIDIITLIIIILHIQSYILFIIVDFPNLRNYPIADIILFHKSYGLLGKTNSELENFRLMNMLFIIALCNIPVARHKIKAIKSNDVLIANWYKYTYIINIIFIVYQFIDYFIYIDMIFSQ